MLYTLRFSLQIAVCFIIVTYLVPVLFTFCIQGVLKLKKIFRRQKVNGERKSHVQVGGLRPLSCWDCGFESRRVHGYLSVVNVVYFRVEVCATG